MHPILNSKIHGSGSRHLLIFHGLFGQSDNWNTLGKKFGAYFTTHLVDLRNHGRSFHSDKTGHRSMAEDIKEYMSYHHIDKANLIGHSLGGKVVMQFALDNPEQVESLIVADMAPKTYPPHHQGIIKGLTSVNFAQINERKEVDEALKIYIPQLAVRQFLLKNVYRAKDSNRYAFRFNLEALSRDYNTLISNDLPKKIFNGKVLFLGGEKSQYILDEDLPVIKSYFPHAQIDTIKNAGHWLHAENPTEFLAKCLSFIN